MNDRSTSWRPGLIVGLAVGLPLMAVGIVNFATHFDSAEFRSFARFYVGGDILHDAIVAPVAALVGLFVLRRVPTITRAPLRAALFATAITIAVAWPALRGYGRARVPHNASVQPLDYTTAVATVVAVAWAASALWLGVAVVRRRRRSREGSQPVLSNDS